MNPITEGHRITLGYDYFAQGFSQAQLSEAYYRLIADKGQERLLFETATMDEVNEVYSPDDDENDRMTTEEIFEAIRIQKFARTEKKMLALIRVLNSHMKDKGIEALVPEIGKPRKSGLFATVTVQIPMSDGQVVSIIFHSPDGDNKKILADDEIIAFRWLLNKRDITQVVSPEGNAEVSLQEIGKRITQLVEKNSARFQATQKALIEQRKQLEEVKTQAEAEATQNTELRDKLLTAQADGEDMEVQENSLRNRIEKQKIFNNDLQSKIDALKAKQAGNKGKPEGGSTLEEKIRAKFEGRTNASLKKALETKKGNIDDESMEFDRRMKAEGKFWRFGPGDKVKVFKPTDDPVGNEVWRVGEDSIKTLSEADFNKIYDKLEDENYHSENLIFLAKRKGEYEDMEEAADLYKKQKSAGSLTEDLRERRYALMTKLLGPGPDKKETGTPALQPAEEKAWKESGADDKAIDAIAKAGGYDAILADESKQIALQDILDPAMAERLFNVRAQLQNLGWEIKGNGSDLWFTVSFGRQHRLSHEVKSVGAGRNVVAITWVLDGKHKYPDGMSQSVTGMASTINNAMFTEDQRQRGGPLVALTVLPDGWEKKQEFDNQINYSNGKYEVHVSTSTDGFRVTLQDGNQVFNHVDAKTITDANDLALQTMDKAEALKAKYLEEIAKNEPPEPSTAPEQPAIDILNGIVAGKYGKDTKAIDKALDDAAGQLEKLGLMEKYDALLNESADALTVILKEKAKGLTESAAVPDPDEDQILEGGTKRKPGQKLFKDLSIGEFFDFIDDARVGYNSFFKTCKKTGAQAYVDSDGKKYRVGSIGAEVFHVGEDCFENAAVPDMDEDQLFEKASKGGLPGFAEWNMMAGGTGAAPGKKSYGIVVGGGAGPNKSVKYSVDPISDQGGRHMGYTAWAFGLPGASGYRWIRKDGSLSGAGASAEFRSPQEAVRACQKVHEKFVTKQERGDAE